MLKFSLKNIINQNLLFMKNEISNGLTIEQLEERMEFTTILTDDQIEAARTAGYTEADLAKKGGGGDCYCPMTFEGTVNM